MTHSIRRTVLTVLTIQNVYVAHLLQPCLRLPWQYTSSTLGYNLVCYVPAAPLQATARRRTFFASFR